MKKIFVRRKYPGWRQVRHFLHIDRYDVVCDAKADPNNVVDANMSIVDWKYHSRGCVGHYAQRIMARDWLELYFGGIDGGDNKGMRYTVWRRNRWIQDEHGNAIVNPQWKDPNAPAKLPPQKKKRKVFIPKSVFHSTPLPLP